MKIDQINLGEIVRLSSYGYNIFDPPRHCCIGVYSTGVYSSGFYSTGVYSSGVYSPRCLLARCLLAKVSNSTRQVFTRQGVYSPGVYSPGVYSPGVYSPGVYSPGVYSPGYKQEGGWRSAYNTVSRVRHTIVKVRAVEEKGCNFCLCIHEESPSYYDKPLSPFL